MSLFTSTQQVLGMTRPRIEVSLKALRRILSGLHHLTGRINDIKNKLASVTVVNANTFYEM